MSRDKITPIATILTLIVVIVGFVAVYTKQGSGGSYAPLGAAGGLLAENYIPYVMYNDGYTSAKGITLTGSAGDLTVGDAAVISGSLTVGSGGTAFTGLKSTTCSPVFSSPDLAASTTAVGICTDSSFTTSDKVLVTQRFTGASTGLPSLGLFPAITVIASTSGQFGIQVTNYTGAATTSINQIYRTYSYELLR